MTEEERLSALPDVELQAENAALKRRLRCMGRKLVCGRIALQLLQRLVPLLRLVTMLIVAALFVWYVVGSARG